MLVRRSKWYAAGRHNGQARAPGEEVIHQAAARNGHVLRVVHDQQQLAVGKHAHQRLTRVGAIGVSEPKRVSHDQRHLTGLAHSREIGPDNAIGEPRLSVSLD